MKPYKVPITGDIAGLEKMVKKAQGEVKRISDNEILLKLDIDSDPKRFKKIITELEKKAPEIALQIQFDINQRALDKKLKELKNLTQLKIDLDSGKTTETVKKMVADIKKDFKAGKSSAEEFQEKIRELFQYTKTAEFEDSDFKFDSSELKDIDTALDGAVTKIEKSSKSLTTLNRSLEQTIEGTNEDIKFLNQSLDYLGKKGSFERTAEGAKEAAGAVSDENEAIKDENQLLNINNRSLKERLNYLKQIKSESSFMENAEHKRITMENRAWDVGGNNPKSEADSLSKIQKYEEHMEHIEKASAAMDAFDETFEQVIITFKNGEQAIARYATDLDSIVLNIKQIRDIEFELVESIERSNEALKAIPSQEFDNEVQKNMTYLENFKNTIKEIDRLKLEPETEETKRKIEELNDLAEYFVSNITAIRSENQHEVSPSMMMFGGAWAPALSEKYDTDTLKELYRIAHVYSGLETNKPASTYDYIVEELKHIEEESENVKNAFAKDLIESKKYVQQLTEEFEELVGAREELRKKKINKHDKEIYSKEVEEIPQKYPEIAKISEQFKKWSDAANFTSSDKWNDFLATLPKAHKYLESIGYDFSKINDSKVDDSAEDAAAAVDKATQGIKEEGEAAEAAAEQKEKFAKANEHIADVTKPALFEDASGQLTFIKELTESEKALGNAMEEVSSEAKESAQQIEGQLSLDFSKATEEQEKFELAVVNTNEELSKLAQIAKAAFIADTSNQVDRFANQQMAAIAEEKRTAEIEEQNKAIEEQNAELEKQKENLLAVAAIAFKKDTGQTATNQLTQMLHESYRLIQENVDKTVELAKAEKEEAEARKANTDAIRTENNARQQKNYYESSGYLRSELGKGDDTNARKYTEKINDFVTKSVRRVKDTHGNLIPIVSYLWDYDKALSSISTLDEKIIKQIHDIKGATEEEAAPMLTNLHLLEAQRKEAEDWIKAMVDSPTSNATESQLIEIEKVRKANREQLQTQLRIKDVKAETARIAAEEAKAEKEAAAFNKIWNQAIAENLDRDKKAHEKFMADWDAAIIENMRRDKQAYEKLMSDWDAAIHENLMRDWNAAITENNSRDNAKRQSVVDMYRNEEMIYQQQLAAYKEKGDAQIKAYEQLMRDWDAAIQENFLRDWDAAISENIKRDNSKRQSVVDMYRTEEMDYQQQLAKYKEEGIAQIQAYEQLMNDWNAAIKENLLRDWDAALAENEKRDNAKRQAVVDMYRTEEMEYQQKLAVYRDHGAAQIQEIINEEKEHAQWVEEVCKKQEEENALMLKQLDEAEQLAEYDKGMEYYYSNMEEDAEYAKKRAQYLEEGRLQLEAYINEAKQLKQTRTKEYENIFFDGAGKPKEVEFAPNTEALRNSNALYDELESHIKEIYDLKEANAKLDRNTNVGLADITKNEAEIAEKTDRIKDIILELNAAEAVQISREEELLRIDRERDGVLKDILNRQELQSRDDMQSKVSGWIEDIEKLQLSKKYTDDFLASLETLEKQLRSFNASKGSIDDVNKSFENLADNMKRINAQKGLSEFKKAQAASIAKLNLQIEEFMRKNTRMGKDFEKKFNALKLEWDTSTSNQRIQELVAQFARLKAEVTAADKLGASFFATLRQRAMGVNAQLIAQYLSWQDLIRYARQGFEAIHELDDALVDLKKTTAMNEDELNQFYYSANSTAKEMGVTTKAIIEQASAWSRLGYNTAQTSEKMAALSSEFASISPGMSTEQAQTGLVSLMKAYDINVNQVERELMDNINVLGNKFAETNLDIVEGMERAGATLSALGTSVQDSFALFTGAQEIIQNAETVGTALKTLSLRIRGFDEETEQLSDDVVKATGKVADLTKVASNNYAGVSLWADAEQTRYRSLVDYLGDIAAIWDEISEKNQTQLLNNLFGKRGASVGSAILQNFDQVKKAIAEMENAAGAANSEMEIIKQSISYKLNELKETWVGILQEMIERGQINDLIDKLIKLSEAIGKVIETIGPVPTLLAGWGLKSLILNLDKVPSAITSISGAIKYLGSSAETTEIFLGETAGAINAIGADSATAALSATRLGKALITIAKSPITWVAVAIGAAVVAWDAFTVTVEESDEKIDATKNKITEIKGEIEKLEELGNNRTKAQDTRLQQLKDELDLQQRILKVEEKRKYAELYGYKVSDFFDEDNYNARFIKEANARNQDSQVVLEEKYRRLNKQLQDETALLEKAKAELNELETMDVTGLSDEGLRQRQNAIDNWLLKIDELQDKIDDINDKKIVLAGDLVSKADDYQAIIDSTQELIDNGTLKGTNKANAEEVIAEFNVLLDRIKELNLLEDNASDGIDDINSGLEQTSEKLGDIATKAKDVSLTKIISDLEELESNLDDVGTAIVNVNEHGLFDLGDLDKIADYFAAIEKAEDGVEFETEAVNNALKLLGEGSGTIEQNADAINTLADNYLRTSGVLKNLTEENKELYITRLKLMGIINAEEVVESELADGIRNENQAKIITAIQDGLLISYKQALAEGNREEAKAIEEKIEALLKEQEANEKTEKSVEFLVKAQEIFSNQKLNVNEKIEALEKLSEAYLDTAEKAKYAAQMEDLQKQSQQYEQARAHGMPYADYQKNMDRIKAEMEKLTNEAAKNSAKVNYEKVQYNGGTKLKDKTGKDAKSTAQAITDAMKKASDEAAKKAQESFKQTIDYFERLIKQFDSSINILEAHLQDVVGAFAKNSILDAQEDLIQQKLDSYSSALDMYSKKASEALSKLPSDIAAKLQNGAVDIDTLLGEANEEVYKSIQEYEQWADKVNDCKQQLVELKEAIRKLELDKFNNILEDFNNQIDLRESSGIDLISKQIDLLKEAGQLIGKSFYEKQKQLTQRNIDTLEEAKDRLAQQMNEALDRGIDTGSEEWLSMVKSLTEVEGKILDAKKALEEFDNALLELHTEVFNRIQDQFDSYQSELSNLRGLFSEDKIADEKGNWTNEGLAQLGLLAQEYELAQYRVEQYSKEIAQLNSDYKAGKYSAAEYAEKLAELKEKQWDSVNAAEEAKKAMIELEKARTEIVIENINKEIDAFEKLINAEKEALKAEKDLNDYRKSVRDANKSILEIQKQLAAMEGDNSQAAIAKRKKLEEQLSEAKQKLADLEADHEYETTVESLEKQYEAYKEMREKEIEELKKALEDIEKTIEELFETVRDNASTIGDTITDEATEHGVEVSEAITDAWQHGEDAIGHYGDALRGYTSEFIENLQEVENYMWSLQDEANETAYSLAEMFATNAEGLVSELTNSYNSEENLANMTNALHDALSDALDGNYSGASATAALEAISAAAEAARHAVEDTIRKMNELLGLQQEETPKYALYDVEDDEVVFRGYSSTLPKGYEVRGNAQNGYYRAYKGYVKGSKRVTKNQLAWTQEDGPEMIISPSTGAILTPLKMNDAVIPSDMTSNLWEWSKFNPEDFANKLLNSIDVPNTGNVTTNTMEVGSLVTINGNVNDTKEMVMIASEQAAAKIKQSWNDFSNTLNG